MADPGVWIKASLALGRPVPVDEPYPHICRRTATSPRTGLPVRIGFRDCAACAQRAYEDLAARDGGADA